MTIGIYKLNFTGTDKVYIGQSVNIENRYKQHLYSLRKGTSSKKLQTAYVDYGLPVLDILLECSVQELDLNEDEAINIFDSCNSGLNMYSTANEAPTYSGYGYGHSIYSKETILICIDMLLDSANVEYTDISTFTGVNTSTIARLALTDTHQWAWDEYPDKFIKMKEMHPLRKPVRYNKISNGLCAKSKGITYPSIKSPNGEVFSIDNAYQFAKDRGLAGNHFQEVLNGHRKSHKGWKLA